MRSMDQSVENLLGLSAALPTNDEGFLVHGHGFPKISRSRSPEVVGCRE